MILLIWCAMASSREAMPPDAQRTTCSLILMPKVNLDRSAGRSRPTGRKRHRVSLGGQYSRHHVRTLFSRCRIDPDDFSCFVRHAPLLAIQCLGRRALVLPNPAALSSRGSTPPPEFRLSRLRIRTPSASGPPPQWTKTRSRAFPSTTPLSLPGGVRLSCAPAWRLHVLT